MSSSATRILKDWKLKLFFSLTTHLITKIIFANNVAQRFNLKKKSWTRSAGTSVRPDPSFVRAYYFAKIILLTECRVSEKSYSFIFARLASL
jgi:hypothetical protein